MPWSTKKYKGNWCVFLKNETTPIKGGCHGQDKDKADAHAKALYASEKLETQQDKVLLEGVGPVLIAAAVTAKPHLRQRGREIRLIEKNGKEVVEVPLFRRGLYRPKGNSGPLFFNDNFFTQMIKNHHQKTDDGFPISDYSVGLDFRHDEKMGNLAFLDAEDGGWLEQQEDWLVAYGPPADEAAKDIIKSRKWRYASAEFHPNYESNLIHKLSTDDLDEVDILDLQEVRTMPKEITFGDLKLTLETADGGYVLSDADVTKLQEGMNGDCVKKLATCQAEKKTATERYEAAEAKIVKLEKGEDDWDGVPEHVRVRLEAMETRNTELEGQRLREKVAFTLDKAKTYRDEHGRGHSKVFLELVEAGLIGKDYAQGDVVVKLEAQTEEGRISFYKNLLAKMAEIVPGQVPMETKTLSDDTRPGKDNGHYTEEELKLEIESFGKY